MNWNKKLRQMIVQFKVFQKNFKNWLKNSQITSLLSDIFSFGSDSFEKLTDLSFKGFTFGETEFTSVFGKWTEYPPKLMTTLFRNIGVSCPNLKSFKLDHLFRTEDYLVPLLFKDPTCLNAYILNNVAEEKKNEVLPFRIVDDKFYEFMEEVYKENIGSYFPNVIKASHNEPWFCLIIIT